MTERNGMWTPDRLRALRAARGWSQERLARALDATVGTVSRWENGHARPSALARKVLSQLEERAE